MNKIWLVVYDNEKKRTWTKYFETIKEKDKFKNKIRWVKNLLLIEDSEDIKYYGGI